MRFFTAAFVTLSTLAAAVLADNTLNPLTYPSAGDQIVAGTTIEVKWTPTSVDETITLRLRVGDSGALDTVGDIATTENDGSYSWTVPDNLPAGDKYAIQILYEGGSNYSPQFVIDSTVVATTTTVDATTTTTAATTETSATETSTTEASSTVESTTTSTTEAPTTTSAATTLITSTVTSDNTTVTTTTVRPTTTKTSSSTGAPDPGNAAGLSKAVSSGLVVLVAGVWALML